VTDKTEHHASLIRATVEMFAPEIGLRPSSIGDAVNRALARFPAGGDARALPAWLRSKLDGLPGEAPHLYLHASTDEEAKPTPVAPAKRLSARARLDIANGCPGVRL
jgi:hypothetical protein